MSSNFVSLFKDNILNYFTDTAKLGSISEKDLQTMLDVESGYLTDLIETLAPFDNSTIINNLRTKFLRANKRNDKLDNRFIITGLMTDTSGKAQKLERAAAFSAVASVAAKYKKILDEIRNHTNDLLENRMMILSKSRLSDIAVLGILREMDLFAKYSSYLFEYFTIVVTNDSSQILYRANYLANNYNTYISILTKVCNKADNYSFLKEVYGIRRDAADLVLYANGNPFTNFFDFRKYNDDMETHITHGLVGFSIFTKIIELYDVWMHAKNEERKLRKEWLKLEQSKLMRDHLGEDPNTPEGIRTQKLIDAYSEAIANLDEKIDKYENDK